MRPDTIVGYTFRAENVCPGCTKRAVVLALGQGMGLNPLVDFLGEAKTCEEVLNKVGPAVGVDNRMDETSFDSDDFPKVIFADQVEDDETCAVCHTLLIVPEVEG